jgi:hypothetical protein
MVDSVLDHLWLGTLRPLRGRLGPSLLLLGLALWLILAQEPVERRLLWLVKGIRELVNRRWDL